ncbi:phosphohydrolase [Nonlabens spongiae]|uniref:Phosphohydrolase n=1 Tax=Nonlabens spongiae TaxID=331648 RepID=A0A1W6MK27_9FLAO|nr:HD domain-containing protein [Nonlabens spongiae]ARN77922.1 phosphohydrolase [Nonlabens spongiae]
MIKQTEDFVKATLKNAESGHDWFHIDRVRKNALSIAAHFKQADKIVVELGALLHDIADSKFHNGDETIGPKITSEYLEALTITDAQKSGIVHIVKHISFKGGHDEDREKTLELQIVQDADRLDAMGAIGIARTFNYGGFKNNKIYDPEVPPQLYMTKEEYKNGVAPTINHFYEKLLLLKDLMNTTPGRLKAQQRHNFMLQFLDQFYVEWNAE